MASVKLDKENPSRVIGGSGLGGKVLKANSQLTELATFTKTNVLSTPKSRFENQSDAQNITKTTRKALGDVINTTTKKSLAMGITPKTNKIKSFQNSAIKVLYNKEDTKTRDEQLLPPVEAFIGTKFDNFDDLFSEGKLSNMLHSRNVSFNPQLPNSEKFSSHLMDAVNLNFENRKEKNKMKRLNKTLLKNHSRSSTKTEDLLQDQPHDDSLAPPPQLEVSF